MNEEEQLAEAMLDSDDDDDDEVPSFASWRRKQRQKTLRKHQAIIDEFLGSGRRATAVGIMPRYYIELLTWALHRNMEREQWNVVAAIGHGAPEPVYIDVSTACGERENLPVCAQLLVEKGDYRFIVTIDLNPRYGGSVQVQGPADKKKHIKAFVDGLMNIAKNENIYRGQNIEFAGRVHFLNLKGTSWDGIILDPATKREVRANTVDFLRGRERWEGYGIPSKRGVLLAGEPGTGKTLICRALMAEAEGISCITVNAYKMCMDEYITDLYEMAQDLSPCIVFIEDIDLIGLNREEYHYQHGPALLSLLNVLDGVEQRQEVVTVATTNNWEALDRAISRRPSRFDRVVKLSLPTQEERRELVGLLCRRIPIDGEIQDYIACRAHDCTPAQLQEIVYGLAIEYPEGPAGASSHRLDVTKEDVDLVISRINGRNRRRLGFDIGNNHNGDHIAFLTAPEENRC